MLQWRGVESCHKCECARARSHETHATNPTPTPKIADGQDEILRQLTREIEEKRREEEEMRRLLDELYQEEAEQKALEKLANEVTPIFYTTSPPFLPFLPFLSDANSPCLCAYDLLAK